MKAPTPTKELTAEGNYRATIYKLVYIGTIDGEYRGVPNSSYKVSLSWELNDEMKVWKEGEEAKPEVVSKVYTFSMGSKSNLRPIVTGIVGGMSDAEAYNFDIDELVGKSCMLQVKHGESETGKAKLELTTAQLPKGMQAPTPYNKQVLLTYQNWNEDIFLSLPEWMRKDMESTHEYQMLKGTYKPPVAVQGKGVDLPSIDYGTGEVNVDDIPF